MLVRILRAVPAVFASLQTAHMNTHTHTRAANELNRINFNDCLAAILFSAAIYTQF